MDKRFVVAVAVISSLAGACAESGSKSLPDAAIDGSPGGTVATDPNITCRSGQQKLWHQTGKSADGQVRSVLNRCASNLCGGGCGIGTVGFAVTYNGRTDAAKGASIKYTKTHHNFDDSLVATLPDRVLKWRINGDPIDPNGPAFQARYFVSVETLDGTPLLAETQVVADQCSPPCGISQPQP